MEVIVYFLIAYGISNIMVFSSIFEPWREFWNGKSPNFFGKLFTCMMCLPFWIGIFLSIFVISLSEIYFTYNLKYISWFFDGCLTSGGVWLLHTLQEKLEK